MSSRLLEITVVPCYRWRQEYGGMSVPPFMFRIGFGRQGLLHLLLHSPEGG